MLGEELETKKPKPIHPLFSFLFFLFFSFYPIKEGIGLFLSHVLDIHEQDLPPWLPPYYLLYLIHNTFLFVALLVIKRGFSSLSEILKEELQALRKPVYWLVVAGIVIVFFPAVNTLTPYRIGGPLKEWDIFFSLERALLEKERLEPLSTLLLFTLFRLPAALMEELAFRFFPFQIGGMAGLLGASLAFLTGHEKSLQSMQLFLAYAFLTVLFLAFYLKTRSVLLTAIVHAGANVGLSVSVSFRFPF